MACIQYLHIFIFFIASLACPEIQFTEGRQLKDLMKNESGANKNQEGLQSHATKPINSKQIPERKKFNPRVTEHRQILPPMTPYHSNEFGSSDKSHSDDFRPTAPGNSPGVGHSFTEQNEFGSSDKSHSDDFRPTAPGNSPGVGHSFTGQKDSVQAKVKSYELAVRHTVAGSTDDFRPTGPGHSPGVGHYYQNMNKGTGV